MASLLVFIGVVAVALMAVIANRPKGDTWDVNGQQLYVGGLVIAVAALWLLWLFLT